MRRGLEMYLKIKLTLTRIFEPSGSVYRWSAPNTTCALIAGVKPGAEMRVPVGVGKWERVDPEATVPEIRLVCCTIIQVVSELPICLPGDALRMMVKAG